MSSEDEDVEIDVVGLSDDEVLFAPPKVIHRRRPSPEAPVEVAVEPEAETTAPNIEQGDGSLRRVSVEGVHSHAATADAPVAEERGSCPKKADSTEAATRPERAEHNEGKEGRERELERERERERERAERRRKRRPERDTERSKPANDDTLLKHSSLQPDERRIVEEPSKSTSTPSMASVSTDVHNKSPSSRVETPRPHSMTPLTVVVENVPRHTSERRLEDLLLREVPHLRLSSTNAVLPRTFSSFYVLCASQNNVERLCKATVKIGSNTLLFLSGPDPPRKG